MLVPHCSAVLDTSPEASLCGFLRTQIEMLEHVQCSSDHKEQNRDTSKRVGSEYQRADSQHERAGLEYQRARSGH